MIIFQALRQQKRRLLSQSSFFLAIHLLRKYMASNRQFPNLPGRLQPSTFGVYVLNYCVRYGNRWNHIANITGLWYTFSCTLKTIQKHYFLHFRSIVIKPSTY